MDIYQSLSGMKYTTLTSRSARKARGFKRSLGEDSDPSEHSSDSGLELDHQAEVQLATRGFNKKTNPTFEEDSNAEYCFPSMPGRGRTVAALSTAPLTAQLASTTRDGRISLTIVSQPEQQHRARYQTEGSRGAVKDRTGNGFPIVKLTGYNKHTSLQIFVGTDVGRVAPHMFYQACRVSGKNSTPCVERKEEGTVLIEVDLDPSKDMLVTCDCVGILKERNVDVEHRFPEQSAARNKKKSTRCRMVFRTTVKNADGTSEILQVCSQPIACTQPPGIPEICKKSLSHCPVSGGIELFILGKNFLKDTRVVFQSMEARPLWEESVVPDKEFLQQNHLVCVVPPYRTMDIAEPVNVRVLVMSSGKASDPHTMLYLPQVPVGPNQLLPTPMDTQPSPSTSFFGLSGTDYLNGSRMLGKVCGMNGQPVRDLDQNRSLWHSTKPEVDEDTMMPPPFNPLPIRRSSSLLPDRDEFKTEVMDDLSQHSMSVDGENSQSPPSLQGVDLSKKPPMMPHLSFSPYLKTEPPQFPVLYENVQQTFVQDTMMRPPPSKILVRDFADDSQKEFSFDARTRSGSFSHSSMQDSSMSGFEAPSRVRSASMSHTFTQKESLFPLIQSFKESSGISSVVKQAQACAEQDWRGKMQVIYETGHAFLQPPFACVSTPVPMAAVPVEVPAPTICDPSVPLVCDASATTTRALDAIVNSAAESHIQTSPCSMERTSPASSYGSSPSFLEVEASPQNVGFSQSGQSPYGTPLASSPQSFSQEVAPQFGELARPSFGAHFGGSFVPPEVAAVPVTVSEISVREPGMGELVLPPGPAPPITGMVPPEMVKMTDIDLISYINPSCFDQGQFK